MQKTLKDNKKLLEEWNYAKNDRDPGKISIGSDYRASWICSNCKGEWVTKVSHRAQLGSGCPYCSTPPKKLKKGYNDLLTYCKNNGLSYFIDEWDSEKNKEPMDSFFPMSNKVAWWECPFTHSYSTLICNRTGGKKSSCPICNRERKTSFAEQAIMYYINKHYPDVQNCNREIGDELDIYIPSLKIAIEYDGYDWHKNRESKDIAKNKKCIENGVKLIRVREKALKLYDDCICIQRENCSSIDTLNDVIRELFEYLNISDDVDVSRDCGNIYSNYIYLKKVNSLASKFPEIAKEFDYELNGNLSPEFLSVSSNKKVWWKCPHGDSYLMSVIKRTTGRNCPICSNHQIVLGRNDIRTYCKDHDLNYIIDEWNYDKNIAAGIDIDKISTGSIIKVWWKCSKCNYEWQTAPNNRIRKRHMCPRCRKKHLSARF